MKHKVIGQGTYGCIHKESLRCNDITINTNDTVSKVLLKDDAQKEMDSNNLIHHIDEDNTFHLGKPRICSIRKTKSNRDAIRQCAISKHINRDKIDENVLIIMKDGGITLDNFADKLPNLATNIENVQNVELFWIETHRLVKGLQHFMESNFIHHDVKPQNLLYNENTGRVNFIDFGLSTTIKKLVKSSINSENRRGSEWWSYPPEYKYINKNNYTYYANNNDPNHYNNIVYLMLTNKKHDRTYHLRGFFPYISYWKKRYLQDLEWLYIYGLDDYNQLVNCCINTFDLYGLGFSLLNVLQSCKHLMNNELWYNLSELLYQTITPNYMKRITVNDLLDHYEILLQESGLLHKHNFVIRNTNLIKTKRNKTLKRL